MSIWGMGAWDDDTVNRFLDDGKNGYMTIGYNHTEAPALYAMFDRIRQGDIIYLKTFYGIERRLTIKAVGIVTQGAYFDEHNVDSNPPGSDLSEQREIASVAWKCTTPCVYPMSEAEMKNNVYNNTLYEEFNHTIGEKIIDLLG